MGDTMENTKKISKKKKIIIITLVILLLATIIFLFLWKTPKENNDSKNSLVKVPDVVGEESSTGQEILEKLGFEVRIEETEDDSKEDMIGRIYKQSEKGKVKKKSKIILSVYVSSEEIKMPDVIGMNKEDAKDVLEKLGFNVTLEGKEDEEHTKDTVISQKAANEDKIVRGSTIKLIYATTKEEKEEDQDKKDDKNNSSNEESTQGTNKNESSAPSNDNSSSNGNNNSSNFNPDDAVDAVPDPKYTVTISGQNVHRKGYGPYKLTAKVSPALPADKKIIWSSSNTSVATVSSTGVITPRATYGKATITATVEGTGYSGRFNIKVLGIKGDLDGDGGVNSNDAAMVLDYIYYGSNAVINSVADVNGDGILTQADADKIMNYYLTGKW